jgi:homoserine O-succinyltransferase
MPVIVERRRQPRQLGADWSLDQLDIGLVNNMPDSALEATERQYSGLLSAAAPDRPVHLHLFSLPEIGRGERATAHMATLYRPVHALYHTHLDALIVTGTEPLASDLREEPYWQSLCRLVDWARDNTASTIFSCLAAHAAVLRLDGIARRPLPKKRFGVYSETAAAHPLMAGLHGMAVPHSRWNELREDDLAARGYAIVTQSKEAGVGIFAKTQGSLLVFIQGHPEYEAETLLREYRRDIGRYLRGERPNFPDPPRHYFNAAARERIAHYRKRAALRRDRELLGDFPIFELRRAVRHSWRLAAVALYRNWLGLVVEQKKLRLAARILAADRATR